MFFWNLQWWFLFFIFTQPHLQYTKAAWPTLPSSSIQILGLLEEEINGSQSSEFTNHTRAMFISAIILSQRYNITIDGQNITWRVAGSHLKSVNILNSTCQAVSISNIVGIVGPVLSRETPIIAEFGELVDIPVISYAATNPALSDQNAYPAFHRTVPSDNAAALAIVKLFLLFNWTSCIIIYQNDAYGSGGVKVITEEFIQKNLTIVNTLIFDITTNKIRDNLKNVLTSSPTRIVLLWAGLSQTPSILQQALEADVIGPNFVWILSTATPLEAFDKKYKNKLIGMLTIEPVTAEVVNAQINRTLLDAAYDIWKQYEPETFPKLGKVDYYALFAFDAAWSLIQSLQKLCSNSNNSLSSCVSYTNDSVCFNRQFLNGTQLFDIINTMTFLGISGLVQFSINTTDRINGNYYLVRNCQFSVDGLRYVPVLNYSDTYDWKNYSGANAIVWPDNTFDRPDGDAKLAGVTLRVGIIQSVPYTIVEYATDEWGDSIPKYKGYVPDLVEKLQNKIGFKPDIKLVPKNQTYQSLVDAINKDYDIIVGDVSVTATRRENVGFSCAVLENALRIVMRKNDIPNIDLLAFMKPFSCTLWLLILLTLIIASVLIYIFEKEKNENLRKESLCYTCLMSLWYCLGHLIGYGVEFRITTGAGRLITAGIYLLSIVLVASYTANLASQLTISNSKSYITGIDDLKSGKVPYNRIGIRVGTASEEFYLREISKGVKNYYPLKSRQEQYDGLLNNVIDVAFLDTNVAEYSVNFVYCNLTVVGEGFDKGALAIITPMQWLYAKDLDVNILRLTEEGVLDELKKEWFQKKPTCSVSTDTSTDIGIESVAGLFVIFAIICVIGSSSYVWKKKQASWHPKLQAHWNKINTKLRRQGSVCSSENLSIST